MEYRLSKLVSYRNYPDFTVLINHADHSEFQMNVDAGIILDKIESGNTEFSKEELDFIEELSKYGLIISEDANQQEETQINADLLDIETPENSIYNSIKEYASQNLLSIGCLMELTYLCALDCKHCYLKGTPVIPKEELSTQEIKNFIDDYKKIGGLFLTFTGGDPFMREDFFEIFSYARKNRFAITIMTSGYKVDHKLLEKMARMGVYHFQASIYGPDAAVHDKFTGRAGSFDYAMNAIKIMRKNNVPARAAVSINKANEQHYDAIVKSLREENIPFGINFIMMPARTGDKTSEMLNVDDDTLTTCLSKISKTHDPPRMGEIDNPDSPLCDAGRVIFSVDPFGTIYPCMEIREEAAGSIREDKLENIWKNSSVLNHVRGLKFKDLKDCPNCELRPWCNRCTGNSVVDGQGYTGHSHWDCRYAKHLKAAQELDEST